jgi:hypothetical protein
VKRLAVLAVTVALLGAVSDAEAEPLPCGLPTTSPLWVDFADASVEFRMEVFGRPGLVLASAGIPGPAELRVRGAQTVYWHMKLGRLTGTPTVPADPTTIPAAVETVFQRAALSSGCATPVIALNELNGVHRPTPWLYETAIYRNNVLNLLKGLHDRGAVPFLLIPGPPRGYRSPFVGGEAAAWWREVAKYAYLVREMHFNAPHVSVMGSLLGSRTRRIAMRDAIAPFTAIGVPPERLGLLLGFQSTPGAGGREGLEPRAAWLEIVKQDVLAARQVVAELRLSSIWSWGWGTFGPESADPDKPRAACVYLWTRDPTFCDGIAAAGPGFNASLTAGQIILPEGVHCETGAGSITEAALEELAAVTGNRQAALTALLNRLLYLGEGVDVSPAELDHAEASLVARHFGGDAAAYQAALAGAGLSPALARELVADQLRRQAFEAIVQVRYVTPSPEGFTQRRQREALRTAVCARDELPGPGVIDWAEKLPFLGLRPASISILATRYKVRRGTPIVLSGEVESERPAELVTLYARGARADHYAKLGTARVDQSGTWSFRAKATGTAYYRAVSKSAASLAIIIRVHGKR